MAQVVIQKQITDSTNTKQIPQVMQPLTKPVVEPAKTKPEAKPKPPTPKPQYKPMPEETRILLDGLEEIGEIIYAMRQKIWQLYGPADCTQKPDPTVTTPKPVPITKPQTKTNEPTILKNNLGEELATFTTEGTKIYIRPNERKAFNINTPPI